MQSYATTSTFKLEMIPFNRVSFAPHRCSTGTDEISYQFSHWCRLLSSRIIGHIEQDACAQQVKPISRQKATNYNTTFASDMWIGNRRRLVIRSGILAEVAARSTGVSYFELRNVRSSGRSFWSTLVAHGLHRDFIDPSHKFCTKLS